MKKFIRLLGFALLMVLIAFVGLIAYQQSFDLNDIFSYFTAFGISLLAPLINFNNITISFLSILAATIIILGLSVFLSVTLLSRLKIFRALMSFIGLNFTLGFALLIVNGYYPDATSFASLGTSISFLDLLLFPIEDPNPGLLASAFSGLVVSIALFTFMFVVLSLIDLIRNPFKKQSSQVLPLIKEETMIAQELSKFVIPSQIRLPQTQVALPDILPQGSTPEISKATPSILEQTPIVVLPQTPALPEKQDIVKARQTVLQLKERIRAQIRLQLLEAKQTVAIETSPSKLSTPSPAIVPQTDNGALPVNTTAVDSKVNEWSLTQIQEKVKEALAVEIAQLEPKTKDQVSTLINEELIKYDSLNREVMESLVSEKIEQILAISFDQFKQEMETMLTKSIQDLQTTQKQVDQNASASYPNPNEIEEQVQKILPQSDLAKKVDSLEQSLQEVIRVEATKNSPELKLSDVETLIEKQTNSFVSLFEKVNHLQQQIEAFMNSMPQVETMPFVKQEVFDTQVEQLKLTQQRLIQLQQDLVSAKGTLDQFQIETLSKTNAMVEKVTNLETTENQKASSTPAIDENLFISLLKKHRDINQPEMPLNLIQGLIATEVKKQVLQTPPLFKDDVKKMIDEAIKSLPKSMVTTPIMDENKVEAMVKAKLPKVLSESDIQTIVKSAIPAPTNLNEGLVLGLISNEIRKQVLQTPSITKEDVKKMIDEAIRNLSLPNSHSTQPLVTQNPSQSIANSTIPFDALVPVIKKKNARAPENDKRAEQFKSVITPDLGVTRTGKKKIVRIPFHERMAKADPMILAHYDELKNYILSYQVKSRISNTGDMFRLHKEEFVKITIAGKSLKLYLALNPEDYKDSPIPVDDASDKKIYKQIPLVFKVKSDLSLKRAKKLVDDLMAKKSLLQKEIPFLPWSKAFMK